VRVIGLAVRPISILLALILCACSSAKTEQDKESKRLWGRERLKSEVEQRAKDTIDPFGLENEKVRDRVLSMGFDEVVARLGFVEYKGIAKFELQTPARPIDVVEDTTIQHGLHGSFRVLELDPDGDIAREVIYTNGVMFVRNGGGEMRVQGIVKDQHIEVRDEAWQPLRVFTSYYGARLALKKLGSASVGGRSAARYAFQLAPGPELVTVRGIEGAKKPIAVSGELFVDDATTVPIRVKDFKGQLDVPTSKGEAASKLNLSLNYTIKTIEGVELKPKSYIPTIKRHPTDLSPLAFLDGGTRTSTVIGGKVPKMKQPPPSSELPSSITSSTSR
jgi:hypothetical protein